MYCVLSLLLLSLLLIFEKYKIRMITKKCRERERDREGEREKGEKNEILYLWTKKSFAHKYNYGYTQKRLTKYAHKWMNERKKVSKLKMTKTEKMNVYKDEFKRGNKLNKKVKRKTVRILYYMNKSIKLRQKTTPSNQVSFIFSFFFSV